MTSDLLLGMHHAPQRMAPNHNRRRIVMTSLGKVVEDAGGLRREARNSWLSVSIVALPLSIGGCGNCVTVR